MKAVIQRVSEASVTVKGTVKSCIEKGLLVLLGVHVNDTIEDAEALARKIAHLRIFDDSEGKMNLSVLDTGGRILVVSQFTLLADCRKGRRPSYSEAARPDTAIPLYEHFMKELEVLGLTVESGVFGAHMEVALVNDGPVTIVLDSKELLTDGTRGSGGNRGGEGDEA